MRHRPDRAADRSVVVALDACLLPAIGMLGLAIISTPSLVATFYVAWLAALGRLTAFSDDGGTTATAYGWAETLNRTSVTVGTGTPVATTYG
jgi:hypothetical protein